MKRFFVTGATGTIGSALVPRLLEDADHHVTLLVRARDEADLAERMRAMHAYWGFDAADPRRQRIEALRGDIEQPAFGLGAAGFDKLAATTSHVIHAAASVKLNMSIEQARASAVQPTREMLRLAHSAAATGVLRKVDLVSTVGVWGRTPGAMPERPLPEVQQFHNTYEQAKAEAERVIWREAADLPISVHRPSMVVGDSASGRVIHFQVFYHLCEFLSGARTFGVMPGLGVTRLDTVPVDWVAAALRWSSLQEKQAPPILHLCSGPVEAIPLPQLQQVVRQAWRRAGRALPRLKPVSRGLLERLVPVVGWLGGPGARRALRALPPVLTYLGEDQSFANDRSADTLARAGLPVPPIGSYLEPVLRYYLAEAAAQPKR